MRNENSKIFSLKDLYKALEYDPWSVANKILTQKNWFWRTLNWISGKANLAKTVIELKEKVRNMETVRLAGLRERDQAGAIGLQLYAENEYLRSQIDRLDPEKYKESRDFFRESWNSAIKDYKKLQRQHEGLQQAHNNLLKDYEEFLEKFFSEKKNG